MGHRRLGVRVAQAAGGLLLLGAPAVLAQVPSRWGPARRVAGPNPILTTVCRGCGPGPVTEYTNFADPRAVIDARGDTTVLFGARRSGAVALLARTRSAGGGWRAPVRLSSGADPARAEMAGNPRGDTVVAWEQGGNALDTRVSMRPAGRPFGPAQVLTAFGNLSHQPIAVAPGGEVLVAWDHADPGSGDPAGVEVATGQIGGQLATQVVQTGDILEPPLVATDSRGDAAVVWSRGVTGVRQVIEASFRPAGGTFGAPQQLSDPIGGAGSPAPALAMDARGDAVVLWAQAGRIRASTRSAGGRFQARPSVISTPGSYGPKVAMDRRGDALAVWAHDAQLMTAWRAVGGRFRQSASALCTFSQLAAPEDEDASYALAMSPRGTAYVAWARGNAVANRASVAAAVRPLGGVFTNPSLLGGMGIAVAPGLAVGGPRALVVWGRSDPKRRTESVVAASFR